MSIDTPFEFIDLVMDNGELVRIAVPQEFSQDCYEALEAAMKRRDWWSTAMFDGTRAEYMGLHIDRVNMARVIAML